MRMSDYSSFLDSKENYEHVRMYTGHSCPVCRRGIEADDDVSLALVVQAQQVTGGNKFHPLLTASGEYRFEPVFFHFKGCWQDIYHDLEKIAEDTDVRRDLASHLNCETCGSGIREWEIMVLAQYGEFRTSRRSPNGSPTYIFSPFKDVDNSSHICIACILNLVGDTMQVWEDISENGECSYCTHSRCWRVAQCGCDCHMERNPL